MRLHNNELLHPTIPETETGLRVVDVGTGTGYDIVGLSLQMESR